MIRLEDVTYRYPRGEKPALQDLTLAIPEGQFFGIVGANGAGKSTLCYALSGFVPHFYKGELSGQVEIDGRSIPETSLSQLAGVVGLVFANPFNQITGARFTVQEEIAFGLENLGVPRAEILDRIDEVMTLFDLTELADRPPIALSGGQQQRLALASIVIMRPRLLVLDEPTSQLDPIGTREVFSALESLIVRENITVVLVSHKLEWVAAFADRVAILHQGQIVADGLPGEILSSPRLSEYGLAPTRFTRAAGLAQAKHLVEPGQALPVILEQAVGYFT